MFGQVVFKPDENCITTLKYLFDFFRCASYFLRWSVSPLLW